MAQRTMGAQGLGKTMSRAEAQQRRPRGAEESEDESEGRMLMSEQPREVDHGPAENEHAFSEQMEIAGSELVERTKELIQEGNVRRLIIRNQDDEVLLEVPLTAGVAVGGAVTLIAPVLAALGAMAALLTHVKVEIVRTERHVEEPPEPQE
jgi:hypothetical protein